MHYLLQFQRGSRTWHLPIADRTASLLEESLLVESADKCAELLAQAIARDPYLALWVAERSHSCSNSPIESVTDAAAWLVRDTAQKLLVGVAPQVFAVPAPDANHYATRAVEVVGAGSASSGVDFSERWLLMKENRAPLVADCPCDELGRARLLPVFRPHAPRGLDRFAQTEAPADRGALAYFLEEIPGAAHRLRLLVRRLASLEQPARNIERELREQKLAALKELAYGASHEINNPLANIAARAQTLLRDEPDPQRRRKLSAIFDQAMRAHEMIADLMLFAHPPELVPSVCNLTAIAQQAADRLANDFQAQQIELVWVEQDDVSLVADPVQLAVAMGAVLKNAVEAVGHGGRIQLSVRADEARGYFVISDDGRGMTPRVQDHLFDPFFSGREAGRGLGFGLSKCWRIVTDHGGKIDVRSLTPSGTEFTIALPLPAAA